MQKWAIFSDFLRSMGIRYTLYRTGYLLMKKTGLLKFLFPAISQSGGGRWLNKQHSPGGIFLFHSKESLSSHHVEVPPPIPIPKIPVGKNWLTNPDTGYQYKATDHWSAIPDLSREAGDIKAVWEASRFTFLYALIRRDFHFQSEEAEIAFAAMEDWIRHNPVNCGPNWICSQEISLRVLNWTFALRYFANSPRLTPSRLSTFLESIYRQSRHVKTNLPFSRNTVRNNHALTETLFLYIIGTLYPHFPESRRWKTIGKSSFEKEIAYQINEEGAFLQHSMNYHRIAVQLFTIAIRIAHENGDRWRPVVYRRARATLDFLRSFQDDISGQLPNYGSNDGALFFPLSSCDFLDFRPQLGALASVLDENSGYLPGLWQEETFWMTGKTPPPATPSPPANGTFSYSESGYFVARSNDKILFIRCSSYRQRPSQSDNLHFDFWENGENLAFDAGTYKYNTDEKYLAYYSGTEAHNTLALGNIDQMQRGPRFTWSHWIRKASGKWIQNDHSLIFEGEFTGYRHIHPKGIAHRRTIVTDANLTNFQVKDSVSPKPDNLRVRQLWHVRSEFLNRFVITSQDAQGNEILPTFREGWYSDKYGEKQRITYFEFSTEDCKITTSFTRRTKKIESSF